MRVGPKSGCARMLGTLLVLLTTGGAGEAQLNSPGGSLPGADSLTRGSYDPRMGLPGTLAYKVPDHGPDEPYAAVVLEVHGAATEFYLRDGEGVLWRIERPRDGSSGDRRVAGRLRRYVAVSLPPGSYQWVGFSRWNNLQRIKRVYLVLDLEPVELEVRPGVVTFGGRIEVTLRDLPRTRSWPREHGWRYVAEEDFAYRFQLRDASPAELRAQARIWRWTRRGDLSLVSGLTGTPEVPRTPVPRTLREQVGPIPGALVPAPSRAPPRVPSRRSPETSGAGTPRGAAGRRGTTGNSNSWGIRPGR